MEATALMLDMSTMADLLMAIQCCMATQLAMESTRATVSSAVASISMGKTSSSEELHMALVQFLTEASFTTDLAWMESTSFTATLATTLVFGMVPFSDDWSLRRTFWRVGLPQITFLKQKLHFRMYCIIVYVIM